MQSLQPLILGASGQTGSEIVRQLAAQQHVARVTYREQAELNTLRQYGCEAVYADFNDADSIKKAMKGSDRVIVILPIHPETEQWGKQLIACAQQAGIPHYVMVSNFTVDDNHADIALQLQQVEHCLMDSGLPYTIARPATYFQNLLWCAAEIIQRHQFSLPLGDVQLPHIDLRDVAQALCAILLNPAAHSNKIYTLTGGESLSMFQVARLIGHHTDRTIRYHPTPPEWGDHHFHELGLTKWSAQAIAEMYQSYAQLDMVAPSDDFTAICAAAPRTYEAFIRENAALFTRSAAGRR